MPLYLDACALAKRYLLEGRSTQTMKTMTSRSARWGGFVVSSFVEPEVVSACSKYVREQTIPFQSSEARAHHERVVDHFRNDLRRGVFRIVNVNRPLLESATDLLRANPEWNIGAADALHLATALLVRSEMENTPLVFVTADRGLAEAARAKGFPVFNPDWDRLDRLEALIDPPSAS